MAGNYEIDNEKFGTFLARLRKEKGMTQKELAEKLFVSDKAVSKWERGLSLPDIALLQPMAELLGASVTELLSGQHIREDQPMTVKDVEPLVASALNMTAQEQELQREHRRAWGKWFFLSLVSFGAALAAVWRINLQWLWDDFCMLFYLPPLFGGLFGAFFIFGAKEKLPAFYDQHRINFYSDGAFRMNVPGVYFNNRNWPHILHAMRIWSCLSLGAWGPVYVAVRWALERFRLPEPTYLVLLLLFGVILGGLFIPVYVVGRKYQ